MIELFCIDFYQIQYFKNIYNLTHLIALLQYSVAIPLHCQVFVKYYLLSKHNIKIASYSTFFTIDTSERVKLLLVFSSDAASLSIADTTLMFSVF